MRHWTEKNNPYNDHYTDGFVIVEQQSGRYSHGLYRTYPDSSNVTGEVLALGGVDGLKNFLEFLLDNPGT